MRATITSAFLACAAAGALMGASVSAHAQAVSAPSSDAPQTANSAVGKMEGSKNGKPTNTNQSAPNIKHDQPDATRTPAPPEMMAPTGQVSNKVPQSQKNPTKLMGTHHVHHARSHMNPPA